MEGVRLQLILEVADDTIRLSLAGLALWNYDGNLKIWKLLEKRRRITTNLKFSLTKIVKDESLLDELIPYKVGIEVAPLLLS